MKTLPDLLNDAYLAGFNASGEGWNAEYPFNHYGRGPEADQEWVEIRDADLTKLYAPAPMPADGDGTAPGLGPQRGPIDFGVLRSDDSISLFVEGVGLYVAAVSHFKGPCA